MTDAYGQQTTFDDSSDYNRESFVIDQKLKKIRTGVPVKVVAVNGGGVGKPPTVDVIPTANMTDGQGNATKHLTIFAIPVARVQGGGNAVIVDPVVGDYGIMLVSDRDISAIKANSGAQSNPGSFRHHSLADGVYVGAILNSATPTQYVQFTSSGIVLHDKNGNVVQTDSSGVEITATTVKINGALQVTGEVTGGYGTGDSVTLTQHVHPANDAPPTPGT